MYKNKTLKLYITVIIASIINISCERDLPRFSEFEVYNFSNTDTEGGTWTPILIPDASVISIEVPSEVSSTDYLSELAELKQLSSDLNTQQLASVEYWTNNPIIRWNEIALELIAKYNLIPGPNEDGTYNLPDPNNPSAKPLFPFSHPPYAVRALAYLSVAQFDGMIAAWKYKYQFKRPSPSESDPNIISYYGVSGVPTYPSDGAVIASVSKQILTNMFPLEVDYLDSLANDHLQSLKWSGSNVSSDILAGQMLGNQIGLIALNRASLDGMNNAQCSKQVSDSIKLEAFSRFGWQWDNIEVPPRPVGLTPLYGKVKMWFIPNPEVVRLPTPPDLDSPEVEDDIKLLKYYASNMTREWRSIANFWQDGLGTYTPPGHWNKIALDNIIKYKLNPLRSARVLAYLNVAMMDGGISCWDSKYYYHYPRPINIIQGFKTIAGTPNFPSYPSGHSVFSAAGAEILTYIFPQEGSVFRDYALEAAISRVYGGIHWTFDAFDGTTQGIDVANYTLEIAKRDGAD